MAVASATANAERTDTLLSSSPPSDASPPSTARSSSVSDMAVESVLSPDRTMNDHFASSQRETESATASRTEEYRQLFRLSAEEVLVQDFNCALQENILLQGHMYVFTHYICFYSNIFSFETKKIIAFHEIRGIKKAKTAGIFPNAIEVFAGGKKYFFASFLSRDEAFKLLNDGWLQHCSGAKEILDQQESISRSNSQDSGLMIERYNHNKAANEPNSSDRLEDVPPLNISNPVQLVEDEVVPQGQVNLDQDTRATENVDVRSSSRTWTWKVENVDAPEIPKSYTKVAETKFPVKVEEFFNLFFSDDATPFIESFHKGCGDKEFQGSSWYPHENFGYVRYVSFQHPIKLYFGAKFGSCQELQKFRVYRNGHLVIETSQEINDVPYGDYFRVEGLWDVVRDDSEANEYCNLRTYVNVAFSKKTVFKGKIVQSTVEECREAYGIWINMAHELLKQKNQEKPGEKGPVFTTQSKIFSEKEVENIEASTQKQSEKCSTPSRVSRSNQSKEGLTTSHVSRSKTKISNPEQENFVNAASVVPLLGEYITKLCSFLRSQNQVSLLLVVAFAVLFLMQVSIVVLLNRPQVIHVASPENYYAGRVAGGATQKSAESVAWLERRMHHLKDEMYMVEIQLERLQQQHRWLKSQLKEFESHQKRK